MVRGKEGNASIEAVNVALDGAMNKGTRRCECEGVIRVRVRARGQSRVNVSVLCV